MTNPSAFSVLMPLCVCSTASSPAIMAAGGVRKQTAQVRNLTPKLLPFVSRQTRLRPFSLAPYQASTHMRENTLSGCSSYSRPIGGAETHHKQGRRERTRSALIEPSKMGFLFNKVKEFQQTLLTLSLSHSHW